MYYTRWCYCILVISICFISFSSCSYDRAEKMVPKWIYEHNDTISHLSISPDDSYIVFLSNIDDLLKEKNPKCSLICLSGEGKKLWEYKGLEYKGVKKILTSKEHILVYMSDHESIDTSGSGMLFLFTRFGKLLWSKAVWGKLYFMESQDGVFVSKYIKRYFQAWGEEQKLPEGCIDPDIQFFGGGDSVAYDVRGASVLIDSQSGRIKKVINIIGIEKPYRNMNCFLSSCIGKTTLYDKNYQPIFQISESGIVAVSPDEQYVAIHYQTDEKNNKVTIYNLLGNLLWVKNVEGSLKEPDGGLVPLYNGFIAALATRWSYKTGVVVRENATLTFFDRKGEVVWSRQKIAGFPIKYIAASEDGKYILVGTEKVEKVSANYSSKMKEELRNQLGVSGFTKDTYSSRLYLLSSKGDIIARSENVILGDYNPLKVVTIDKEAEHAVLVDTKKIFFYDTGVKKH